MQHYRNAIVRELNWCIASPPLMLEHRKGELYDTLDQRWFWQEGKRAEVWLSDLDRDPSSLEEFMEERSSRLLGKRFELLVEFWLEHHPSLRILLAGQTLQEKSKTVGELDFVFRDDSNGEIFHMEVACKFYLGYNNSRAWRDWKGPNASDTLKLKMDKLLVQLGITHTPAGRLLLEKERIPTPRPVLMMKGYFFHHFQSIGQHQSPSFSNPEYPAGFWCWLREIGSVLGSEDLWMMLPKNSWLAPYAGRTDETEYYSGASFRNLLAEAVHQYKRGIMIVRLHRSSDWLVEDIRGFVVPNAWPGK